jgi:S-formylglutathione hydrolase FrmB
MTRRWTRPLLAAAAVCAVALSGFGTQPAGADPAMPAGGRAADGSAIESITAQDARHVQLGVYSVAMRKRVRVNVQLPKDRSKPRPVLYLLNGLDAGLSSASWSAKTDVLPFLLDKDANVVQPVGGYGSYYADWIKADPRLGLNKWRTFLTEELPPLVNAQLGADGRNVIAGLSTSGTSVLALAEAAPGLYRSVASYSGCAEISDPMGHEYLELVVHDRAKGNLNNMYGPPGDPRWVANDPYVHADRLRGTSLFISSGSGLPGAHDRDGDWHVEQGPGAGVNEEIMVGGAIEAAVNVCTHRLAARLTSLRIPATFDFTWTGTHSWGYWEDAFKTSWPMLAEGLGIAA